LNRPNKLAAFHNSEQTLTPEQEAQAEKYLDELIDGLKGLVECHDALARPSGAAQNPGSLTA
jgi:hypothetical protein